MAAAPKFRDFSCLTFDCYGTLIDWETGIWEALAPLRARLSKAHPLHENRSELLKAFSKHVSQIQSSRPHELYSDILAESLGLLAEELGLVASEAEQSMVGASVGDWKPFPDTVGALKRLKKHFKLVILSNIDRESFSQTLSKQLVGVEFDAVYTAQDIGSYKPDLHNFEYLLEHCKKELGVSRDAIIHTAHSVVHDLVPVAKIGLANAWIERGAMDGKDVVGDDFKKYEDQIKLTWRFNTLGAMADAVDAEA